MNLYNLIFQMVIPFLTQPPHERTLTGRGSGVYPNVGAAGCGLAGAGGVLGLRPRGSGFALAACCMNSYYTINKKMYELVQKPHPVRIRTIQFV